MHWNAMNIQRCAFFASIAAPDATPIDRYVVNACIVNRDRGIFLAGRFRSGENPGGGVWRTRED